jgi:hypothetical protein
VTNLSTYNSLAHVSSFLTTFDSLKNQHKISQSALILGNCCNSVIAKLRITEKHLYSLLSTKEWIVPSSSASNATGSSGNTIATTYPTISPETVITAELDDFFIDLKSSFEMLGQVINLIFFDPPYNENEASFALIANLIKINKPQTALATHLNSFLNAQWFVDLKEYRERAYHQGNILWEISMKHSNVQSTVYPQVLEICIQDKPNSPTFAQNKNVRNFCLPLFQSALTVIDKGFQIIEIDVKNANKIPI